MVGGEDHVHAGDEAADPVPIGVVLHHGLLEEHGVAPVPEVDAGVGEGIDRLAVDDEALDSGAPEAAVSAFLGRRGLDVHLDEAGRDLAPEECELAHARRPGGARRGAGPRARTRVRRGGGHGGAVAGPRNPGL